MSGLRRLGWSAFFAGILTVVLVVPALAGGWAVVTLDRVPTDARAGQALSLGFMVRQHGVTPIDVGLDGRAMVPVLTARNSATGATLRAESRKEGALGHFVVDVTFPAEGAWTWEITPAPFAATELGTLTVGSAGAPVVQAEGPGVAPVLLRDRLRWGGVGLVIVAGVLVLVAGWGQRAVLVRRRPLRAR